MPLAHPDPTDRPLTPGEALAKLFMDNADRGANAANDELIEELQRRIRALRKTRKDPGRPPAEPAPVDTKCGARTSSAENSSGVAIRVRSPSGTEPHTPTSAIAASTRAHS